jgi:hypothetical protein
MLNPDQLLGVAKLLASPPAKGAPVQAKLRRAISTAYYALFHTLVAAASDLLVGGKSRGTQRYLAVYRSFEHKRMADVCRQVSNGKLLTDAGVAFHATIQECANAFVDLQENRHEADYDPAGRMTLADARAAVSRANDAIQMLQASPDGERFLFLTLLHFKLRS